MSLSLTTVQIELKTNGFEPTQVKHENRQERENFENKLRKSSEYFSPEIFRETIVSDLFIFSHKCH